MCKCDSCIHNEVCEWACSIDNHGCNLYRKDFELGTSQEHCMKVLKYIRSYCKNHECDHCQFYSWCGVIGMWLCPENWSLYRIEQIGRFKENSDNG